MKQDGKESLTALRRTLRDKTREAEILHRVSETVSGNLDLDAVLHDIVDISGWDWGRGSPAGWPSKGALSPLPAMPVMTPGSKCSITCRKTATRPFFPSRLSPNG